MSNTVQGPIHSLHFDGEWKSVCIQNNAWKIWVGSKANIYVCAPYSVTFQNQISVFEHCVPRCGTCPHFVSSEVFKKILESNNPYFIPITILSLGYCCGCKKFLPACAAVWPSSTHFKQYLVTPFKFTKISMNGMSTQADLGYFSGQLTSRHSTPVLNRFDWTSWRREGNFPSINQRRRLRAWKIQHTWHTADQGTSRYGEICFRWPAWPENLEIEMNNQYWDRRSWLQCGIPVIDQNEHAGVLQNWNLTFIVWSKRNSPQPKSVRRSVPTNLLKISLVV